MAHLGQAYGRIFWIRTSDEPTHRSAGRPPASVVCVRRRAPGRGGGDCWRGPVPWPWALRRCGANHAVPRGAPDFGRAASCWARIGHACRRAAAPTARVAITIDDGPDPDVTPQVLSQLAEHRAQATFFCVGDRVARYPDLAREIVRRGHVDRKSQPTPSAQFFPAGSERHRFRDLARPRQHLPGDRQHARGFFARPRGCAIPFLIRSWRACSCGWPAGRAAASIPSTPTRMPFTSGWRTRCKTATFCCCTMATPLAAAAAER